MFLAVGARFRTASQIQAKIIQPHRTPQSVPIDLNAVRPIRICLRTPVFCQEFELGLPVSPPHPVVPAGEAEVEPAGHGFCPATEDAPSPSSPSVESACFIIQNGLS